MVLQSRDGGSHGFCRRAAGHNLSGDGVFDGRAAQKIGFKVRRDFLDFGEQKLRPGLSLLFGFAENFADQIVRLAERNAFVDKVVCGVRGEKYWIGSSGAEAVFAKLRAGKRTNGDK